MDICRGTMEKELGKLNIVIAFDSPSSYHIVNLLLNYLKLCKLFRGLRWFISQFNSY